MNFITRLKQDKKFRMKVILLFIIGVIILGKIDKSEVQKQSDEATCAAINEPGICNFLLDACLPTKIWGGWYEPTTTAEALCKGAGCIVGWAPKSGPNVPVCVSCVPDGYLAKVGSDCCHDATSWTQEYYGALCKSSPEGQTCTSTERSIGSIVGNMFPSLGCKMSFYIVAVGGGLLVMMMMMAIM